MVELTQDAFGRAWLDNTFALSFAARIARSVWFGHRYICNIGARVRRDRIERRTHWQGKSDLM